MEEPKIGWRRLDDKNVWIGVRGRVKFFTLRVTESHAITDQEAESQDWVFLVTHHMDNGRPETLAPMTLHEAKVHAENELDGWLRKAGLVEDEQLTPTQHAVNSALGIIEATQEDGIRGLVTEYERERFAERIALYCVLSTLANLAMVRERIEADERPLDVLEQRREELYKIMHELKDRVM